MKLEDVGFYTLSDKRAVGSSIHSPLWRCELILTDRCNFKCAYCRSLRNDISGDMPLEIAEKIVYEWARDDLKNIRYSGGEPTLYPHFLNLIVLAKRHGIERIAISTNGSAPFETYERLYECGVNDFSISLDACCSQMGDRISRVAGSWSMVTNNIERLSKLSYVTVGIVLTDNNNNESKNIIEYASSLGVSDIRIIPAAQFGEKLSEIELDRPILDKHPILKYRHGRAADGKSIRGLCKEDSRRCKLVLDDMAIGGNFHFPCIIYLREGGSPIGEIGSSRKMRDERERWYLNHDTHADVICKNNCIDVCVAFNNKGDRANARGVAQSG